MVASSARVRVSIRLGSTRTAANAGWFHAAWMFARGLIWRPCLVTISWIDCRKAALAETESDATTA